jgi:hypothetical protein
MLGGLLQQAIWDRSWNIIFTIFWHPSFLGLVGSYMKIMKGRFFMLPTGKRQGSTALQVILYNGWLIIVITAFLRLHW